MFDLKKLASFQFVLAKEPVNSVSFVLRLGSTKAVLSITQPWSIFQKLTLSSLISHESVWVILAHQQSISDSWFKSTARVP